MRSKKIKMWRQANAKTFYGMSLLDVAELSIKVTEFLVRDANEQAARFHSVSTIGMHTAPELLQPATE